MTGGGGGENTSWVRENLPSSPGSGPVTVFVFVFGFAFGFVYLYCQGECSRQTYVNDDERLHKLYSIDIILGKGSKNPVTETVR